MLFSEEFLASFKDNPIEGTIMMIQIARKNLDTSPGEWLESDYQIFLEVYALINEVVAAKILPVSSPTFPITGDINEDCKNVNQYLTAPPASQWLSPP